MEQLAPALIMLFVTLLTVLLLALPIKFSRGPKLAQFYWKGFWVFLTIIAFVAGGSQVLMIMGMDVDSVSIAILQGIMTSFVLFVAFGWFRLVGAALFAGFQKVRTVA